MKTIISNIIVTFLVLFASLFILTQKIYATSPVPATPTPTKLPPPKSPVHETIKDGKLSIAWISVSGSTIFNIAKKGALKKAYELSKGGDIKVEIIDYSVTTSTGTEEIRKIDQVITKKGIIDAIILRCFDSCRESIDKAVEAGIPVIMFDNDSPESHRLTFYSVDNFMMGKMAAQLLQEALPNGGDIGLLNGEYGVHALRGDGFKEGVEGTKLTVSTEIIMDWDLPKTITLIEDTMKDYPELDGWFWAAPLPVMEGGAKLFLWKKATQKGMITISGDALPQELDWVRAKKLYAIIDQPYWGWGYNTVQMMYDHILYGKQFDKVTFVTPNIITQKNVNAYQEAFKKNDFSKPIPSYK